MERQLCSCWEFSSRYARLLHKLIVSVSLQDVDKHLLHLALDCLASLLLHADSCRYILPLCKAVCSQLSTVQGSSSQSKACIDSLEIMSNDIRESMEIELAGESESDDEEAVLLGLYTSFIYSICTLRYSRHF